LNRSRLQDRVATRLHFEVLLDGFNEVIGLSVHPSQNVAFASDLGGTIYRVALDGSHTSVLLRDAGNLTGIVAV